MLSQWGIGSEGVNLLVRNTRNKEVTMKNEADKP